ncbi:MAG TPA: hypothetical protein EYG73_00415 [Arcobacter sp.]|nr:hypothetical protein [Arcobacter sp.]
MDVDYLVNLLDRFHLDFYEVMDEVEMNFGADGKVEFNTIIYEVLNSIAHKFLEEHKEMFESKEAEFEIYTNYMDSHIYFTDEFIQSEFEGYF